MTPVLNELAVDGVVWQARRSADRGRLEVVAIVPPSAEPTTVRPLTEAELRQLLEAAPVEPCGPWICGECGTPNERERRWCRVCSGHQVA